VRSKVVRLEEITDRQYGGVAEKFSDLSVDVGFVMNACISVWDEDNEEKQVGLRKKFSVMSIDCKEAVDVDALNAEKKNEMNEKCTEKTTEKHTEKHEEKKAEKEKTEKKKTEKHEEKKAEKEKTEKKNENDAETREEGKPVEKRTEEKHRNDVEVEDGPQQSAAENRRQQSAAENGRQRNAVENGNLRAVNGQLRFAREDGQGRAEGTGWL